jgi:TolB-like protein
MLAVEPFEILDEINRNAIQHHLHRILEDPLFSRSRILQRFLRFIVEETLQDRTNCLKEYTIGIKVLDKPSSFNPQSTSIVRIHAVRLRKALDSYYVDRGVNEQIRISLPPGHYIPVFMKTELKKSVPKVNSPAPSSSPVVAVMPFYINNEPEYLRQFTDGMGALLANSLMETGTASVISYFSTRRMAEQYLDIREIAKRVAAKYIFTGDVQVLQGKVRISVQLVKAENGFLEWFQSLDVKFSKEKVFELQRQVINKLMVSVVEKTASLKESENRKSMMAVA